MAKTLVTDELWAVVEPLLPREPPKPKGGRPRIDARAVLADGSMEARGVLSGTLQVLYENGRAVCENGLVPRCDSQNTKRLELRFRAVLGDGTTGLSFERAAPSDYQPVRG